MSIVTTNQRTPWNKGKLVGQKFPLKLKDVWAIRIRVQLAKDLRELAMFNLALDSKLRACDLVRLKLTDISHGSLILHRATIMQKKTGQPVQFEITEQTRESLINWIREAGLNLNDYLFPRRIHTSPHITTRQYSRIVKSWVTSIGLDTISFGQKRTLGC
ncbi:MAG: tyrosine-type recombinase/integrase [Pseudomonadales bacterium]|nr:tyrosine-type recombinase/integrase [Pseudomonadales bacterium]